MSSAASCFSVRNSVAPPQKTRRTRLLEPVRQQGERPLPMAEIRRRMRRKVGSTEEQCYKRRRRAFELTSPWVVGLGSGRWSEPMMLAENSQPPMTIILPLNPSIAGCHMYVVSIRPCNWWDPCRRVGLMLVKVLLVLIDWPSVWHRQRG